MNTATGVKLTLALAAGVAAFYLARKAGGVAAQAVNAVNPFNNDNIINRGFTSAYQGVTGSNGSVGTDLYDWTHPPATQGQNPIYGSYNSAYQLATGSKGTIGTDLYDMLHPPKKAPAPPPVDNTVLDARDALAKQGGFRSPTEAYYDPLVNDSGMDFRFF